ncbi:MAG TPA: hypothetical protein VME45_22805 [Stellaceae bacterium]|nr:hypothetical protein [Stellaceae bacterium]
MLTLNIGFRAPLGNPALRQGSPETTLRPIVPARGFAYEERVLP